MATSWFPQLVDMAAALRLQGARPVEVRMTRENANALAREIGQPCWRPGLLADGIRVVAMEPIR